MSERTAEQTGGRERREKSIGDKNDRIATYMFRRWRRGRACGRRTLEKRKDCSADRGSHFPLFLLLVILSTTSTGTLTIEGSVHQVQKCWEHCLSSDDPRNTVVGCSLGSRKTCLPAAMAGGFFSPSSSSSTVSAFIHG